MTINWKTILGAVLSAGAALGIVVPGNIGEVLAHPGTAISIVLSAIAGVLFGHNAGAASAGASASASGGDTATASATGRKAP